MSNIRERFKRVCARVRRFIHRHDQEPSNDQLRLVHRYDREPFDDQPENQIEHDREPPNDQTEDQIEVPELESRSSPTRK